MCPLQSSFDPAPYICNKTLVLFLKIGYNRLANSIINPINRLE